MEHYAQRYYAYQTTARGLFDAAALRRRFEALAPWYAQRLRDHLPHDRGAAWLDVPCGSGNFLYFLRRVGYRRVIGCDADPEQVRLARLLDLPAETADALTVIADDQRRWDAISALDFVEHLSRDDALRFLDLCRARLRPGGVLILRTPCADGPFGAHDRYNDLTHQWAMTSNLAVAVMAMVGFERVAILDERPRPTSPLNAARWLVSGVATAVAATLCHAVGVAPPRVWTRSMWVVCYRPGESCVGRPAAG
jgi:2-polyprenyl-3-methyl-5-hydroxy-6-metoxy-1,4-benzoquinol methylase